MIAVSRRNFLRATGSLAVVSSSGVVSEIGAIPSLAQANQSRIIVPFAAGGATDKIAYGCLDAAPSSIENRTSSDGLGTIGMDLAMKAQPDGRTLLVTDDNVARAPHVAKLGYDYTKVFAPIITIGRRPLVLAVSSSLGVNTVADLIASAKANPRLEFGTVKGSSGHVAGLWIAREAGISLTPIPYRTPNAMIQDMFGGHLKMAFLNITSSLANESRGIKILAQTSARRNSAYPNIPTLEEAGLKGLVLDSWWGVFAPGGTPAEFTGSLNSKIQTLLRSESRLRRALTEFSIEPVGGTPKDLGELAQSESAKYERLVKELNISI